MRRDVQPIDSGCRVLLRLEACADRDKLFTTGELAKAIYCNPTHIMRPVHLREASNVCDSGTAQAGQKTA